MTNEQFAEMLSVSTKTVSRALNDTLQPKGYITIINPKSKSRSFQLNRGVIEADVRQKVQDEKPGQNVQDNMDKLSNEHGQNDPIKDNKKINIKDKETVESPRGKVEAVREVMKSSTDTNGEFKF
jgi:hypothetical protein